MYKVKVTVSPADAGFNRQLPHGEFVWKDYQFYINQEIEEVDFWVVCFQKLPNKQETCRVAPENTMFVTWEPDSVYHFSQGFLNQFGKVVSCQENLKHRNLVKDHPGLAWHMGQIRKNGRIYYSCNYDSLKVAKPEKTKLLSVISSNKAFTKGHRERIDFVEKLKAHFGDQMDVFGRGFNGFDDKWDVIAPYKYHICIENCSIPYYWSEKLADAYLGSSFPFYYGCSNIKKYFDDDSYRVIDLHDADSAIKIIEEAITEGLAEKNIEALEKAKYQVLDEYNFFELIVRHFKDMDPDASKIEYTIKHDLAFLDIYKLPLYSKRFISNMKYKLKLNK